ncbi:hypothetical protein DSECCO2_600060 [anaerobic digester metagenome]
MMRAPVDRSRLARYVSRRRERRSGTRTLVRDLAPGRADAAEICGMGLLIAGYLAALGV